MSLQLTINGEARTVSAPVSVAELLGELGYDTRRIAVEVNRELVPRSLHAEHRLIDGDAVEIVRFVGGGSSSPLSPPGDLGPRGAMHGGGRGTGGEGGDSAKVSPPSPPAPLPPPSTRPQGMQFFGRGERGEKDPPPPADKPLVVGPFTFRSRLITGTGKYATYELMKDCLEASGCEATTVAVRRERLVDKQGRNVLDYLDLNRYTILPNTAGCYSAEDAVRHARLARELLTNLDNPGAKWVKLECLGDPKTLLPDPVATLQATEQLVNEGFVVLVYTSDDPIMARRLKQAGAASVMPAGSPIGSGQGILNPNNIRIILEFLKDGDPGYPVIVDAGVGTASDVAVAMELGCDGVLLNTGIAGAQDPLRMAFAMRAACEAGRWAYLAGRIPRKLYAQASSPMEGMIR